MKIIKPTRAMKTMKTTFFDKENDLLWTTFGNSYSLTPNDYYFHDKFTQELATWDSEAIRRYVIPERKENLGEYLNNFTEYPYGFKLFYALKGKRLVGAMLVSQNESLRDKENMKNYIRECILNKSMGNEGCLDLISAIKGLTFSERNNFYVEYLVVNPNYVNCGIGKSMIQSVITNPEFFNNKKIPNFLITTIHKQNAMSQSVFDKNNNFKKLDEKTLKNDPIKGHSSYNDYYLLNESSCDYSL